MALRRRLAERISKVKERAGVETPILDEVPLKAEILESFEFPFPEVKGVIPVIAKGRAYGATAGRWYRVLFPRPMIDPSVVCVGEARRGEIPEITLPPIRVGAVPEISPLEKLVAIPEIPSLAAVPEIEKLVEVAKDKIPSVRLPHVTEAIGRFTVWCAWPGCPGWLYDLVDMLNAMVEIVEAGLARINDIIDKIDARLEMIRTTINEKLAEIDDRLDTLRVEMNTRLADIDERIETLRARVNDRLGKVGDGVDERFETVRTGVNSRFGELRDNTEASINDAIKSMFPLLYAAWGVPRNMALTALHIRNVTSTGFEFQSYGDTTCFWIAIGSR